MKTYSTPIATASDVISTTTHGVKAFQLNEVPKLSTTGIAFGL